MPYALAIGVPYDVFWHITPKKLESFEKAYRNTKRAKDEENWLMGQYNLKAFSVALDRALHGRKAKSEYFKEPVMWKFIDESELTEEEKEKREMEREILSMEQWISNDRKRGLPETKMK